MKLLQIGGGIWKVLLVVTDAGTCPVLDTLIALEGGNRSEAGLAKRIRRKLEREVPNRPQGPDYHNDEISRFLRDDIYEFKRGQNRGPGLRVLWFYGFNKQVICTTAFLKRDKTPKVEIDNAIAIRMQYYNDLENEGIEIVEVQR